MSKQAILNTVAQPYLKTDLPKIWPGDTVKASVKVREGGKERIQLFEGTVIARGNRGAAKSFTVRKMSHGVGVERVFLLTSPTVAKSEVAQSGKVRRAKLYYLREREGKSAKIDREMDQTVVAPTAKN